MNEPTEDTCYCGAKIVQSADGTWLHENGSMWCYPDEDDLPEENRCNAEPERRT